MSKKSKSTRPLPDPNQIAVSPNTTRPFPLFWQQLKQAATDPDCPPPIRDIFLGLLSGRPRLLEISPSTLLHILEDLEGWSMEEAKLDPWACPVIFSEFKEAPQPAPPASNSRTAQVLNLRDGQRHTMPLEGEVLGLCLPDSQGTLIMGASPGLSIEELSQRLSQTKGIDGVSLVAGPMSSLPDGAFFALLTPGAKEGTTNLLDYFLFQLLGKDGLPPEPPRRPWQA